MLCIYKYYKDSKYKMPHLTLKDILSISKKLEVLYVEDNKEARESTLLMLGNFFENITIAIDGAHGLECYTKQYETTNKYFDIVITDIEMPHLDGIAMAKAIFKIHQTQKILFISAYTDKQYLVPLLNMGIEGFLYKPLEINQVNEILMKICMKFKDSNTLHLGDKYIYDKENKVIQLENQILKLNKNEIKLLELFINNTQKTYSLIDIFQYIFEDEFLKEYSADSIRSLIKRVRKKLPENFLVHNTTFGYSINLPK